LAVTVRLRQNIKNKKSSSETVYHLSTLPPKHHTAHGWSARIRAHWSIENANHWRRDACLLEDKTPGRNPFVLGNIAMARATLLFYNAYFATGNINATVQGIQQNTNKALMWLRGKKCAI